MLVVALTSLEKVRGDYSIKISFNTRGVVLIGMVAASESLRVSPGTPVVEPTLDSLSFLPTSPSELRVGDQIESLSGTRRTVLLIAHSSGNDAVFQFQTTRSNGSDTTENVNARNLSLANAKEVHRRLLSKMLRMTPSSHALHSLSLGDVLIATSGERYLVTGFHGSNGEARYFCLVKSASGELTYGQFTSAELNAMQPKVLLRWEHPASTTPLATADGKQSSYIPFNVMFNLESLLGRGELGDRFVIAMSKASMTLPDMPGEFSLSASVNERSRQFGRFVSDIDRAPKSPQIVLRMRDTGDGPFGIAGFIAHGIEEKQLVDEVRHAMLLANTLKGLFDSAR